MRLTTIFLILLVGWTVTAEEGIKQNAEQENSSEYNVYIVILFNTIFLFIVIIIIIIIDIIIIDIIITIIIDIIIIIYKSTLYLTIFITNQQLVYKRIDQTH